MRFDLREHDSGYAGCAGVPHRNEEFHQRSGAIDTLLVDIDSVVPGSVDDETGAVTFANEDDASTYGVIDQITVRTFANGGTVLAVRREDIPGGKDPAAILRYPL